MKQMTIDSPLGPLTLVADGDQLAALHFGETVELDAELVEDPRDRCLVETNKQLTEYFRGKRRSFDIPLAMEGTEFEREVWKALLEIPFGETRSYGEIAKRIGRPKAVRAVGRANGKNPVAVIVPCHRVIGSDGSLTGYGGGEPNKKWLLDHERQPSLFGRARD